MLFESNFKGVKMNDIILYFACKFFGDWERIYDAIEKQEDIDFEEIEELKERYKGMYITIMDDDYPLDLKRIDKPPFVIFYKGRKELLNSKKIWYFGTYFNDKFENVALIHRNEIKKEKISLITGYSNDFEKYFVNSIKPNNSIIIRDSGINSYINMTRIEEELFIKDNLIISEYPDKVIPSLYTWESSNRIKHGLADGLFLLNTLKEKITFKIIADAIDENKDIFCYDKEIDSRSHNTILINKGAYAINKIKEIWNG